MKQLAATALSMSLAASAPALAERHPFASPVVTIEDVQAVSPALAKYTLGACLAVSGSVRVYRRAIAASSRWQH